MMPRSPFTRMPILLFVASLVCGGCGILYTDVQVPRAYRSASPIDVSSKPTDPLVTGKSCNQSVLFLFAWGSGGYVDAVRNALEGQPPGSVLYDVQIDLKAEVYVIGLYTRTCTIVTGKVGSL